MLRRCACKGRECRASRACQTLDWELAWSSGVGSPVCSDFESLAQARQPYLMPAPFGVPDADKLASSCCAQCMLEAHPLCPPTLVHHRHGRLGAIDRQAIRRIRCIARDEA